MEKDRISVSVRSLVEFILRSGDIDDRRKGGRSDSMTEGSRIHRMLQSREGSDYHAEVSLRHIIDCGNYDLVIDGRADGIIIPDHGTVTIDEIKGIYRELKRVKEAETVHLAQAKCYAYIYALQNSLSEINVRMTYCNMESEDVKYFHFGFTFGELKSWFNELMDSYRKWADFTYEWREKRNASIKKLEFPFEYREGQKELAEGVYRTIYLNKRLFLEAPTGTGKTLAVLFPAIKAMGEGLTDRIFYTTAKTVTGVVASESFDLLRKQDFLFKTVTITAKEKMCLREGTVLNGDDSDAKTGESRRPLCNPVDCPYAKGHYDRINDALYDFLTTEDDHGRNRIKEFAEERRVCPFELALDLSLFSDAVVLDYNYCFDPNVKLKRFFGEGVSGNYIFLVDEAHNLVDRAREMFSEELYKEDFLKVKALLLTSWNALSDTHPATKEDLKKEQARENVMKIMKKLSNSLGACSRSLLPVKKLCDPGLTDPDLDEFMAVLTRAAVLFNEMLEEAANADIRIDSEVLELYFNMRSFLEVYEAEDEKYVNYAEFTEEGKLKVKLFNVDPSGEIRKCTDRARSTVFFSATLLPVTYYMDLLSGDREDYTIYAKSSFDNSRRGVFVSTDVSSKYTRRTENEYIRIAAEIREIISVKKGNYIVFFPSYAFLKSVEEKFRVSDDQEEFELVIQERYMDEDSRTDFLNLFSERNDILAFCVAGGIFSEGIDLREERLIGAIIVGTALPMVGLERTILKEYFDGKELDGFDYAYRFPGMNKVLQAAGRVIRTEKDKGVVALLDDRFMARGYRKLFPREWDDIKNIDLGSAAEEVGEFWE